MIQSRIFFRFALIFFFEMGVMLKVTAKAKSIMPWRVLFNLNKGGFSYKVYDSEKKIKRGLCDETGNNKRSIQTYSRGVQDQIYDELNALSFSDTSRKVFPNYKTDLKLVCVKREMNFTIL